MARKIEEMSREEIEKFVSDLPDEDIDTLLEAIELMNQMTELPEKAK